MDLRFQVLVSMLAGWLNRQQQDVIEYQREEVSILLGRMEESQQHLRIANAAK